MSNIGEMFGGCRPEINYPCSWQYSIIGWDREAIIAAVKDIVGVRKEYLLHNSHSSSKGRYISMKLELVLESEEMRLSIYDKLVNHAAIKMVL